MKIVAISIGIGTLLATGAYSGLCFLVGAAFVHEYEGQLSKMDLPNTQIEQGIFSSKLTTVVDAGLGKISIIAQVDHMVTPTTLLTADTKITPDEQTTTLISNFFTVPPAITIRAEVKTDGHKTLSGQIEPMQTKPNPMFTVNLPEPAKFVSELNDSGQPTSSTFNIPTFKVAFAEESIEMTGFSYKFDVSGQSSNLSLANQFKLQRLLSTSKKPKSPKIQIGPMNLYFILSGITLENLKSVSDGTTSPEKLLSMQSDIELDIKKSTMKTNFGRFRLDGKLKLQGGSDSGSPIGNGSLAVTTPFSPRAKRILGKSYATIGRILVKNKLAKKIRGHLKSKIIAKNGKVTLNGKPLAKFLPTIMAAMNATKPNLVSQKNKKGNGKGRFKKSPNTKTAH